MPVVACPKCSEKVLLPPKTPPAAKVRCPLCSEHYLLSEALATLPPMLEVLELPDGFSLPSDDVSISTSAFLATPDRSAPTDDEGTELKLQGEGAAVATLDGHEPRYDEWGATSSSTPAHDLGEPQVKRELLSTKPRKKKKGVNPIIHMVGIVAGGALAFPIAFLILLWMPGDLRRDPLNIGTWLGERAPYLVPSDLRKGANSTPRESKPPVSSSKPVIAKNKSNGAGGGIISSPTDVVKPATQPVADPFSDPKFTNSNESPTIAPVADPFALTPEPKDKTEIATPEPSFDPVSPLSAPEPSVDPTVDVDDALTPSRDALASASEAFDAAPPAERKNSAIALYMAAAQMAEKLPGDARNEIAFEGIVSDPMKLRILGMAAAGWYDKKERDSNGIVLSGSVKSCTAAGERFEVLLELPKDKREILVIAPAEVAPGDNLFVAGRIVENAKSAVSGYEGEAEKAVDARIVELLK